MIKIFTIDSIYCSACKKPFHKYHLAAKPIFEINEILNRLIGTTSKVYKTLEVFR
jgi:hypothetical protein